MLTTGRSAPSITPCCAAVITSAQPSGTATAPMPFTVSVNTFDGWVRIFRPRRSRGSLMAACAFQK